MFEYYQFSFQFPGTAFPLNIVPTEANTLTPLCCLFNTHAHACTRTPQCKEGKEGIMDLKEARSCKDLNKHCSLDLLKRNDEVRAEPHIHTLLDALNHKP